VFKKEIFMWITKYETKKVKKIIGFKCDRCKKECTDDTQEEALIWSNFCGYHSIFGDGNKISLHLCQECIKEVLGDYLIIEGGDNDFT